MPILPTLVISILILYQPPVQYSSRVSHREGELEVITSWRRGREGERERGDKQV